MTLARTPPNPYSFTNPLRPPPHSSLPTRSHTFPPPHTPSPQVRDGEKRIVTIQDGDPTDCHCVIVDDLVQTGGTLIECATAIQQAGALSVSAFVTHAGMQE